MPHQIGGIQIHTGIAHIGDAERGVANGVAPLNAAALVPQVNLGLQFSVIADVTLARAIGNEYQNLTGRTMWVVVNITSGGATEAYAYSDPVTPAGIAVAGAVILPLFGNIWLGFMVAPDEYYRVDVGGGAAALAYWAEYS